MRRVRNGFVTGAFEEISMRPGAILTANSYSSIADVYYRPCCDYDGVGGERSA